MSKHTPGPWRVNIGDMGGVWIVSKSGVIAGPPYCGEKRSEWAANAHLMAAAPDLLEALEPLTAYAREGLELGGVPTWAQQILEEMVTAAEVAIKKAKGEIQ